MSNSSDILLDRRGMAAIVTLNRPAALNAVNLGMVRTLRDSLERWRHDGAVTRVVVTAAGGRAFSAGGDFAYLEDLSRDPVLRAKTIAHGRDLVLGLARCRVPVVAAVNGPAAGLGCSLVALSDVVYMATSRLVCSGQVSGPPSAATSPTCTCGSARYAVSAR